MNARDELIECLMKVKLPFSPARAELLLLGECERLADKILAKLPRLGFVRLDDVEIDRDKMMNLYRKWGKDFEERRSLIQVIIEAKGILRVKE